MTPAISVLLDWTRFCLALVVAGTHLTHSAFQDGLPDLRAFALIAVGGFFLLSGYTIRHITRQTHGANAVRRYLVERAARLLSVSLPALAFTAACDACASHVAPVWYARYWGQNADHPLWRLLSNAVLFSQPYGRDISPLSNDPFWSLSYEAGFYVIWGAFLYARSTPGSLWIPLLACAVYGPNIVFMLPFWLLGVLLCDQVARVRSVRDARQLSLRSLALLLATTCVFFAMRSQVTAAAHASIDGFFAAIHVARGRVAISYMFGSAGLYLVLATLLPILALSAGRFSPSQRLLRWSRALGQATFPIYVMHFPLYVGVTALHLLDRSSLAHKALLLATVVLLALLFAPLADRLKDRMRRRYQPTASRPEKLA